LLEEAMSMHIQGSYPRGAPDPRAYEARAPRPPLPLRARKPQAEVPDLDIRKTMDGLEKLITRFNRRFEFILDEQINRIVVKVIDKATDKVIKEIPPEEIQHLIARLRETMGLLVDEEI
jgi:flagellar protein FlaG